MYSWMWSHGWLSWFFIWCYTCVYWFSPLWCKFLVFFHFWDLTRLCFWCICLYCASFHFNILPVSGCNYQKFTWLDFYVFFAGFSFWSFSRYEFSMGTLRGSAWVNGRLYWYELKFGFLLGSPVGVYLGMLPRVAPLEVLLGRLIL